MNTPIQFPQRVPCRQVIFKIGGRSFNVNVTVSVEAIAPRSEIAEG